MTDNRVQMTDGRGGERWGWFGFQVSGFKFQVLGVRLLSPPETGGEEGL